MPSPPTLFNPLNNIYKGKWLGIFKGREANGPDTLKEDLKMNEKTIRMSNGRPVSIDLENWITWATATDYDYAKHPHDLQSYSSLHVLKRDGKEKYLVFGKSHSCYDGGHTTYAGILIANEDELTDAMRQVMDDLGLVDEDGNVGDLLRKWEQDLPAVDLD